MPQIREQIAMVHLPPSKTLKYLFHVRKTLKPHRSDAVLFYADIKTLKDYKAIVGILSKTKHRPFSHSAKGPVILLFVMLICRVQSYP